MPHVLCTSTGIPAYPLSPNLQGSTSRSNLYCATGKRLTYTPRTHCFGSDWSEQHLQQRATVMETAYLASRYGENQCSHPVDLQGAISLVRSLHDLLRNRDKPVSIEQHRENTHIYDSPPRGKPHCEPADVERLQRLFQQFRSGPIAFKQYLEYLEQSMEALKLHNSDHELSDLSAVGAVSGDSVRLPDLHELRVYIKQCEDYMDAILRKIVAALTPGSDQNPLTVQALLQLTGLQPQVTAKSILDQLDRMKRDNLNFPPRWKPILILFGISITRYQRAIRMYRAAQQADPHLFTKTWENIGYVGWDPAEFPQWVLFEIENDLLIRPTQATIAKAMINPRDFGARHNAVMQLNMGEGKSSVIVPIVALTLANEEQLVRIVVPKTLRNQMAALLKQRLGGLLNRRIYQGTPFSRELTRDKKQLFCSIVPAMWKVFQDCMEARGILLTQPEHLLSLKLTTVEMMCMKEKKDIGEEGTGEEGTGEFIRIQRWLSTNARDVIDETDEVLHPRYELIYTLGRREPLELGRQRWILIQRVLSLVIKHMSVLEKLYPGEVEVIERPKAAQESPTSFPLIRLIGKEAEGELMARISDDIVHMNLMEWVPQAHMTAEIHQLVVKYIREKDVKDDILSDLAKVPEALLLLKGLIGGGLLAFVLREKRWCVDYGPYIDNDRDAHWRFNVEEPRLAVPYRAKDLPANGAQFAHPDLAIVLTCLCYYYQGLSLSHLRDCFKHLHRCRGPPWEYRSWITENNIDKGLPPHLRCLNGVDIGDDYQFSHVLYPLLKLGKRVIDFYLSTIVFPAACKMFSTKLTMSAWDLAEKRRLPTTGFSGTNDTRYILPTSIEQIDNRLGQLHTNAKVVSYLLRPENNVYECAQTEDQKQLPGEELLRKVVGSSVGKIQVLIDVGAQILDMDNEAVARYWLSAAEKQESRWTAALFFDTHDEPKIITKQHEVQSYLSSPYVEDMAGCLVYLDEARTRGTDIKLPVDSVGAVTLGPKLTKDKLVQACMRMRRLGQGQSVRFFAPPEVHQQILIHKRPDHGRIEIIDILSWAMHESCIQIQRHVPLWASQGIAYQTRQHEWEKVKPDDYKYQDYIDYIDYITACKQPGFQTLEEMYSTSYQERESVTEIIERKLADSELLESTARESLETIRNRCEAYKLASIPQASLEEHQEREVVREVITKEHPAVEPPPISCCYRHRLAEALVLLVDTGVPPPLPGEPGSPFCFLMDTLKHTSFRDQIETEPWSTQILTTIDFSSTIILQNNQNSDCYLRPVTWIMSTREIKQNELTLIILSPFEVNELLPRIQESKFVNLHMYSAKIEKSRPSFYDLTDSLTIPALPDPLQWKNTYPEWEELMIQISLYAGDFYFASYDIYKRICLFLGIYVKQNSPVPLQEFRGATEFENHMTQEFRCGTQIKKVCFRSNPLGFLGHLVKGRANGMKLEETHIGYLTQMKILHPSDWEDEGSEKSGDSRFRYGDHDSN